VGALDRLAYSAPWLALDSAIPQSLLGALTLRFVGQEAVDLGDGTVEGNDIEAMVGGVQNQILAHDGQANKAKVTSSHIVSI
jgi:hypothetical protein